MTKYLVIATAWLNEMSPETSSMIPKPVKLVVGEFAEQAHANLFKKTYEKAYSTTAFIVETKEEL